MSEKARGAIFNALGDISGLTFLDAYSGSGALSIEAISRGAVSGVAIDIDRVAFETIIRNSKHLGVDTQIRAYKSGASNWSDAHQTDTFDLLFVDPPYDNIHIDTVQKLTKHIAKNGLFVLSWPGRKTLPEFASVTKIAQKSLGDIQLIFYRY